MLTNRKTYQSRLQRSFFCVTLLAVALSEPVLIAAPHPVHEAPCTVQIEGEVRQGESYIHAGPRGLDFMLEAIPSGWIIRMLRHGEPRGEFDYAGLATPPYQSPNPILISTDFNFRAQDAIGWNPRHFQYFQKPAQMQQAIQAYRQYVGSDPSRQASPVSPSPIRATTPASQAGMAKLLQLTAAASEAEITLLDAHMQGGTTNQTAAAALVATHFSATPHQMDPGPATALGKITWMRFRISYLDSSACGHKRIPNH